MSKSIMIVICIALILLILNILLLYHLKRCKREFSNEMILFNNAVENVAIQNKALEDYYIEQIKNDYKKVNNVSLSNNSQIISLLDFSNNEDILIFYAPENACSPCYDGIIEQFNYVSKRLGNDKFLVIVPENKFREFSTYFKRKNFYINLFSLKKENEFPEISDGDLPYFCIVSKDLRAKHTFIPPKDGIEYFKKYINAMKEKYFNY
ncbi:MAG: hypothetical protein R6U15_03095 [Candidatus Izemoplasmatales bacterium]